MNIQPPPHDDVVYLGMLFLGLAAPTCFVFMLFARRWPAWLALIAWLGGSGWLAQHGLLQDIERQPPAIGLLSAASLVVVVWLGTAGWRDWIRSLSGMYAIGGLLLSQTFRLPLELIMLRAAELQIMPWQFSARGYNLDLATGLLALLLTVIVVATRRDPRAPSRALWLTIAAWNAWGIFCLIMIAMLAVLTSPTVQAFGNSAASINTWVLFFPYAWLPVVLVPTAVLGHLLTTCWLLENRPVVPGAA